MEGTYPVVTWLKGSSGSTHGKTTSISSATMPSTSTTASATFAAVGPGRCRQIQPYTSVGLLQLRRSLVRVLRVLRVLVGQHRVQDQPVRSGELRRAGGQRHQRDLLAGRQRQVGLVRDGGDDIALRRQHGLLPD